MLSRFLACLRENMHSGLYTDPHNQRTLVEDTLKREYWQEKVIWLYLVYKSSWSLEI